MPLNVLYNTVEYHYEEYGKEYPKPLTYIQTGAIREYDSRVDASDTLIMTGASSNHIICVLSCILSCVMHLPLSPVLFVDYGVNEMEQCWLEKMFEFIHQFHSALNTTAPLYYRKFNWSSFPSWMDIKDPRIHGGYTWKPISVVDALYQWKAVVMWNDAGNYFQKKSLEAFSIARSEGLYMPPDMADFSDRFAGEAIQFMIEFNYTKPFNRTRKMGSAIFMLFDYRHEMCRRVIVPWLQCAYTRRCMALKNKVARHHKPEQGILTILLWKYNFSHSNNEMYNYSPLLWLDRTIKTINNSMLRNTLVSMSVKAGMNNTASFNDC